MDWDLDWLTIAAGGKHWPLMDLRGFVAAVVVVVAHHRPRIVVGFAVCPSADFVDPIFVDQIAVAGLIAVDFARRVFLAKLY